jgi:PIN domain nuclease of toxin-antitoxin system
MMPFALSAMTLLEIALLSRSARSRHEVPENELFRLVDTHPAYQVLPITTEVAREYAALAGGLPDPADRVIVATARVHGLYLLTSDERIIASKLVPVID